VAAAGDAGAQGSAAEDAKAAARAASTLPWWTWLALPFASRAAGKNRDKTFGHVYVRVVEARGLVPFERTGRFSLGPPYSSPFVEVAAGQHVIRWVRVRERGEAGEASLWQPSSPHF
jgi:hypothetical protein